MVTTTTPTGIATLNGSTGNATLDAAVLANIQKAIDTWMPHLSGLGTVTVQMNLTDMGHNGVLANCSATRYTGSDDDSIDPSFTTIMPDTYVTLNQGSHLNGIPQLNGVPQDITVNLNTSYLNEFYTGLDGQTPSGLYDLQTTLLHEMARGLGFGGATRGDGSNNTGFKDGWDHYLTPLNGSTFFTGANAEALNGGAPVQVCTTNSGEGYSCISNGGDAYSNDLMSGLGLNTGMSRGISNMDLAILADVGAPVVGIAGVVTLAGTSTLSATTGHTVSLGGVTLADTGMFSTSIMPATVDSSIVTLTVSDTRGLLAASRIVQPANQTFQARGATVTPSSDGHTLTLAGSLVEVQADLATMTYSSALAGPDTVDLSVVDSAGNTGSGSVAVTVTPGANYDTPVVTGITASASVVGTDARNTVRVGAVLTYTLTTSGPVIVSPTGTLSLTLGDQGTAAYNAAASTSTSLVFTSVVQHDQFGVASVSGISQSPGALTNADGGPVTLSTFGAFQPITISGVPFVDATGPIAPGFGLANSNNPGSHIRNVSNTATPVLSGVAFAGDTVVISDTFGGTMSVIGTATADSVTGLWSMPVTTPLADGVHSLTGVATDPLKGLSDVSSPVLVTIDTVAPVAPTLVLAAASGGITAVAAAVLTGTAEAGDYITIFDNGVSIGEAYVSSTGSWTATLDRHPLAMGANALTASAMDEASNVSTPSASLNVTLVTPSSTTGTTSTSGTSTAPNTGAVVASTSGTTTAPAAPALPFTLDGVQAGASAYTADAGTHFAVVNAGSASIVANASASSAMTVYGNGGSVAFTNGGGSGLVVGTGLSSLSMTGGKTGSTLLAFTGTGATSYTGGAGADEVISGGGNMSLTGGTGGSLLVFGGAGTLNLVGNDESDMIIGGAGAETVRAGLGAVFGGSGGSLMFANGAGTFLAGNVAGDQLNASAVGGDILAGGAGNETLNGAGSANGNIIFAGAGADLVSLGLGSDTFAGGQGSDTVQAGAGSATLYLGTGGSSLINFTAGSTGGTDTLSGFRVGTDHLSLNGYAGLATTTTAGGNTTLGLTDGTKIILQGVTSSSMADLAG